MPTDLPDFVHPDYTVKVEPGGDVFVKVDIWIGTHVQRRHYANDAELMQAHPDAVEVRAGTLWRKEASPDGEVWRIAGPIHRDWYLLGTPSGWVIAEDATDNRWTIGVVHRRYAQAVAPWGAKSRHEEHNPPDGPE